MVVFNKLEASDFTPSFALSSGNSLDRHFPESLCTKGNSRFQSNALKEYRLPLLENRPEWQQSPGDPHVNFVMLPKKGEVLLDSFEEYIRKLHTSLCAARKKSFRKTITEREWLRGVHRTWDLIRKSPHILSYNKLLHQMQTYK